MLKSVRRRLLDALLGFAAEKAESEETRIRKVIGVVIGLGGFLACLTYACFYWYFGETAAGWWAFGECASMLSGLVYYRMSRRFAPYWIFIETAHLVAISMIHVCLGGFVQSGLVILYVLFAPILTIVALSPRSGIVSFLVVSGILILAAISEPAYLRAGNGIPPAVITGLYVANSLGLTVFMLLGVFYYVWRNEALSRRVKAEERKVEALLLNILPSDIAAILKDETRTIADQFESVSVLFADIVNFTPMSAGMKPRELVELLNEVFSDFDRLTEKYGLEKIKTIGDCYMVAAGIPRPRPDHAAALADFALELREIVANREFRGKRLSFRIGINSGPVIAGVIGHMKFIYDLWGDAVNTASRMESQGEGGAIQITEATKSLIEGEFVCEYRGTVMVKGKGEMPVWRLVSRKESA